MSPAAETVLRRLDAARQKWWFFSLLTTTTLAACASFGTLLAFMLADAYVTPAPYPRRHLRLFPR